MNKKIAHQPRKGRVYASKYKFPNPNRKASSSGKGDGDYRPGWFFAKQYLEDRMGVKLEYVGSRLGQWCFCNVA